VQRSVSWGILVLRILCFVLCISLVICVTVQVFLAGMALFADSGYWSAHRRFVHVFSELPLLLLLFSFLARLPAHLRWGVGATLLLLWGQYALAHIRGPVGALHPVMGMVLWGVLLWLTVRVWQLVRQDTA